MEKINSAVEVPLGRNNIVNDIQGFLTIIENVKVSYDCGFKGESLWYIGVSDMGRHFLLPSILRGSSSDNNDYKYEDEYEVYESFRRESRSYININDDNFLLLCYAQHFNVPTRLLDFTINPLVALYFACKELKSKDGAVWILNSKAYNKQVIKINNAHNLLVSDIKEMRHRMLDKIFHKETTLNTYNYPIAVTPYYIDQRMMAQGSRFFLWGDNAVCLEHMLTFDDYMDPDYSNVNAFVMKIKIPYKYKADLLNQLDMLGINEKSLFPGLDGIGKYIKQHYMVERSKKAINKENAGSIL